MVSKILLIPKKNEVRGSTIYFAFGVLFQLVVGFALILFGFFLIGWSYPSTSIGSILSFSGLIILYRGFAVGRMLFT